MFKSFQKNEFWPRLFSLGATAFLTSLISIITAFSILTFLAIVKEKIAIKHGHDLVKQNCYSCHHFRFKKADPEAPSKMQEIDTSQFSEKKLRYRMENPPSNTNQIYNKKDQDAAILFLRSQE